MILTAGYILMGFLDWLFKQKKNEAANATAPQAQSNQRHITTVPDAPVQDNDDEFAEATTFVSRRLPATAQREVKKLRSPMANGAKHYTWTLDDDRCEPCNDGCNKFVDNGPYSVALGLSGQAPVPGRESLDGEC